MVSVTSFRLRATWGCPVASCQQLRISLRPKAIIIMWQGLRSTRSMQRALLLTLLRRCITTGAVLQGKWGQALLEGRYRISIYLTLTCTRLKALELEYLCRCISTATYQINKISIHTTAISLTLDQSITSQYNCLTHPMAHIIHHK